MRLVEAIACELVDQVEQLVRLGLGDVVHLRAALDEQRALRVHLRLDLLAHRAAQQVGAAERIAGQDLRGLHHLFLIDEDAVGFLEDTLQQRVRIFDRLQALLTPPEHRNIVHRTRAIERDERDDVAEIGRPHRRQRAPHPFGFELEHAHRLTALEQFIDRRIVPAERGKVDADVARGEQLDRLLQHRQRLEAKEVELHQPRSLDIFHVELRHRHVRARIAVQRDELRQRTVADHHARRMGGRVARQSLQPHGEVDQVPDIARTVIFRLELAHPVQRARQRPRIGRVVRDQLCQPVDLAIAHLQHAPGILEHRARAHRAECDDLRDLIAPVLRLDVADHLATPGFAKVDVEVGHRHAFRVQESLEQQPQRQRIEVGNRQRPGDHAARTRTTPRPHRNPVGLGPFDEVRNDQEVTGKPHLDDDVGFERQPVEIFLPLGRIGDPGRLQPRLQPGARVGAQLRRLPLDIAGQAGQDRLALGRGKGTALRHHQRVVDRLGQIVEQPLHLGRWLHPRIGRGALAIVARDIGRTRNAQHRVMRLMEIGYRIADRVGGDDRDTPVIGQFEQLRLGARLNLVQPPDDLDIQPVAEQPLQPVCISERRLVLFLREHARQPAFAPGGQRDQPVGPPLQRRERDMRVLFDRPVEMRHRHEVAEILIARFILRKQRQPVERRGDAIGHVGPLDAQQRPNDRLHPGLLGGVGIGHRGIKPVAITQPRRRKPQLTCPRRNRLGLDRAFQHCVGGEDAEGYETGMGHGRVICGEAQGSKPVDRLSTANPASFVVPKLRGDRRAH